MSKVIVVEFKVDDTLTPEELHEALCLDIHEQNTTALDLIADMIDDIRIAE